MLEEILVFSGFALIIELTCKPFKNKIKQAESVSEALAYRKKMKIVRWVLSILFVVLFFVVCSLVNPVDFWFSKKGQNIIVVTFFYLIYQGGYEKLRGNISTMNKSDFLKKHSSFALFLRGFGDDVYGDVDNYSKSFAKFSEYHFMEKLNPYTPACAIGMTKEADAPRGAIRLYVSDESWKEDVRELMEKSNHIFILLNNRPSCLWEIEQSSNILEKTYFFVEHDEIYRSVRENLSGVINFPEYSQIQTELPFVLHVENNQGSFMTYHYDNTDKGYETLLDTIFRVEGTAVKKKDRFDRIGKKFTYIFFVLLLILPVNIVLAKKILALFDEDMPVWILIFVALFYLIEWILYLNIRIFWRRRRGKK